MAIILVVEDDALISMWVEDALTDAGHTVRLAGNADHAMRFLESDESIEVVFTDIDMPGSMDGLDLAAVVHDKWPPLKIVIASGNHRPSKDEMPPDAMFLQKPYLSVDAVAAVCS